MGGGGECDQSLSERADDVQAVGVKQGCIATSFDILAAHEKSHLKNSLIKKKSYMSSKRKAQRHLIEKIFNHLTGGFATKKLVFERRTIFKI